MSNASFHGGPQPNPVRSRRVIHRLVLALALIALAAGVCVAQTAPAVQASPRPSPADLAKWEPDIAAFEAADRAHPAPAGAVLFTGSSSIRLWTTLARDFPGTPVLNRGFGGSQIREVTAFAERIVLPYKPPLIVFYCGANDIHAGLTAEQVLADYRAFVSTVHAALPATKVAFISIAGNPARWSEVETVNAANRLVAEYSQTDPRLQYIDVYSKMLGADGRPKPDIFVEDDLHMNAKGYAIWTDVIGRALGLR